MNWTIRWLDSAEYFRVSLSGTFSLADAKAASSDVVEQSDFSNGDSLLIDDTRMDMGDIGASDIEAMSNMMGHLDNKVGVSKVAIVGCSDLQFGLARQFQLKTESYISAEVRAFRYEAAAVEWLADGSPPTDSAAPLPPLYHPLISIR